MFICNIVANCPAENAGFFCHILIRAIAYNMTNTRLYRLSKKENYWSAVAHVEQF